MPHCAHRGGGNKDFLSCSSPRQDILGCCAFSFGGLASCSWLLVATECLTQEVQLQLNLCHVCGFLQATFSDLYISVSWHLVQSLVWSLNSQNAEPKPKGLSKYKRNDQSHEMLLELSTWLHPIGSARVMISGTWRLALRALGSGLPEETLDKREAVLGHRTQLSPSLVERTKD